MLSAEKFIEDFHSLEGVTLGERKSNFNKLLKSNLSLPQSEIESIAQNLKPRTYLESLFKIDVLLAFKRTPELLDILKEGNEVFIKKIVKNPWFLREAFADFPPETLINSVLPAVSFSARMKILTQLSRCLRDDYDRIDGIFDCVRNRYGLFVASTILHRCSAKKIEEIATNFAVDFTSSHLKVIFLKNPKLIETYFTECKKRQKDDDDDGSKWKEFFERYQSLIRFIFLKDPKFCIELSNKFNFTLKVGRKTTKKLVDLKKDEIIAKPKEYKDVVNLNSMYRQLGREKSKKFIENYLDSRAKDVSYQECKVNILQNLPAKLRYELFSQSFEAKFNTSILNSPDLINVRLLDALDNKSQLRVDLARAKLKSEPSEDDFIKYLPVDESIPLLKEKLRSSASIKDRSKYVKHLLDTCIENDNVGALVEILKYFYERHRNDRRELHEAIAWKLYYYDKKKYNEELWKISRDLEKIREIKFNSSSYSIDNMQYVEFLFNQNKLSEDELVKHVQKHQKDAAYYNNDPVLSFYNEVPEDNVVFRKYLLNLFLAKPELFVEDNTKLVRVDLLLIQAIDQWNKKYKNDPIVDIQKHPRLMKSLRQKLDDEESNDGINPIRDYLKKIVRGKIHVEDRDYYIRGFLKKFDPLLTYDNPFAIWFLKYAPKFVSEDFTSFLKIELTDQSVNLIKKYSHLGIDEKLIEFTLSEDTVKEENRGFNDRSDDGNVVKKMGLLSQVYSVDKFIAFADNRKPLNPKFDVDDGENAVELYKSRCQLARGFKYHTGNNEIVLPALLNYCVGDYFGSALESLRKILCHTPENRVSPIIEQLAQSSVSIRKHALTITCEICDVVSAQTQLKLLKPGQDVTKRRVMKTIMSYFRKNPTDEVYEIVKPKMAQISLEEDCLMSACAMTTNIRRIPKKYQSGYVEFVWNLPKEDDERNVNKLREQLLDNLYDDAIKELPIDFCLKILEKNFFKDSPKVRNFVTDLLIYHPERIQILKSIFELLDEKNEQNRLFAYFFVYYNRIMKEKIFDHEFLQTFSTYFEDRISPTTDFDNYVRLQFFKLRIKHGEKVTIEIFNDLVHELLNDLISKYGRCISVPFGEVLQFGVKFFAGENQVDVIKYYEDLLRRHESIDVALLVMQMLQPLKPSEDDSDKFAAFKSLMDRLKGVPDPGVQIILKRKYWNCLKDL